MRWPVTETIEQSLAIEGQAVGRWLISRNRSGQRHGVRSTRQKRQKLLELVRGRALARPTDLAEDEVMVWPSLVVVEAVCAVVFLFLLLVAVDPRQRAAARARQPNQTPNPSKAPWYFLNLQELLLHMDPGSPA